MRRAAQVAWLAWLFVALLAGALLTVALHQTPAAVDASSATGNSNSNESERRPGAQKATGSGSSTLCVVSAFKGLQDHSDLEGKQEAGEVALFVKYMSRFLQRMHESGIQPGVPPPRNTYFIVTRQSTGNGLLFNRGALVNAGARVASALGCSYIAVQDIDLLPVDERLDYTAPPPGVIRCTHRLYRSALTSENH